MKMFKSSININKSIEVLDEEVVNKILYRRQFILFSGKLNLDKLKCWSIKAIYENKYIVSHPDLEVYQAKKGKKSITLIGYILDPFNTNATNSDLINELIEKFEHCSDIILESSRLGGRWILIVDDGREKIIFNDAAGLRQVYYFNPTSSSDISCASQPGLIAEALNLEMDEEALEYIQLRESADNYDEGKVYWWPGDTTFYSKIKILLPNHYLNLDTGIVHRYWPVQNLNVIPLREAINRCSEILKGLISSAHNRYKLALSLTAGWDSRLMMAACKNVFEDLYFFTLTYPYSTGNASDVRIPTNLMKKFGTDYHLIRYPENVNNDFRVIFRKNCPSPSRAYAPDVQGMFEQYPQDRVCITGDVAEVAKCFYRLPEDNEYSVSAYDLAKFTHMGSHPFVLRAFEKWLSTGPLYNINLLDLFSWEQVGGRWQALNQSGHDIVQESFSPYNCRILLTIMLSVDEKYRKSPAYTFHKKLISNLWKEVLSEPINPPDIITLKTSIIDILIRLNIYQVIPESAIKFAKRMLNK